MHSFGGDDVYSVVMSGWTHIRGYHKGYLRNTNGNAIAKIIGLFPNVMYEYNVYQFASNYKWENSNSYSVNGVTKGPTSSSNDPQDYVTSTGTATSNENGELVFTFTRQGHHVSLSGLGIRKGICTFTYNEAVSHCEDRGGRLCESIELVEFGVSGFHGSGTDCGSMDGTFFLFLFLSLSYTQHTQQETYEHGLTLRVYHCSTTSRLRITHSKPRQHIL